MRSDADHLQGILDAATLIRRYTGVGGRAAFDANQMVRDAGMYRLAAIGEAAKHLSPRVRDGAPHVPWSKIIRMRNILVHDFLAVNRDVVWTVASTKLDELEDAVKILLAEELL